MKKRLILGGAMALAMLVTNSAYAYQRDFGLYICNLSKRTIHFKKTYNYQANTNDDYSQDFIVAPNNCSGSINFWGKDDVPAWVKPLDNQIQWTMTDNNTGENLGEIDYHGTKSSINMRFGIGSAQLSFVDYPKDSILNYKANKYYTLDTNAASYLPFSHRTTVWFEDVYGNLNDRAGMSYFQEAHTQYKTPYADILFHQIWGTLQITEGIPQSPKTYEDFEIK